MLAEHAGAVSPDGMPRLLRTAGWEVDGVRGDLRGYVLDQLGHESGVCTVDEAGVIKGHPLGAGGPPVHRHQQEDRNCQLGCSWPTPVRVGGP